VGGVVVGSVSASGLTGVTVASWQMNEPGTATVMSDSSGSGITGAIGDLVSPGGGVYGFAFNSGVQPSRRLVVVNDDDRLDPGPGGFAVEMRFLTTKGDQNLVQKGQANAPAGTGRSPWPKAGRSSATSKTPSG
jgi:hypothetical protein